MMNGKFSCSCTVAVAAVTAVVAVAGAVGDADGGGDCFGSKANLDNNTSSSF